MLSTINNNKKQAERCVDWEMKSAQGKLKIVQQKLFNGRRNAKESEENRAKQLKKVRRDSSKLASRAAAYKYKFYMLMVMEAAFRKNRNFPHYAFRSGFGFSSSLFFPFAGRTCLLA